MPDPVATSAPAAEPAANPGSQTLETASNLLFGNPPPSQSTPPVQSTTGQASVAPDSGQGDGTGQPASNTEEAPTSGQADSEVTNEDVLAALSPTETPEQTIARIKRDAGASREEALRLKKVEDGTKEIFEKQGLQLVTDETGKVIGVAPTKNYNNGKAEKALSVKFTDFSEDDQVTFERDPQALIDHVLSHARNGMARVAPTVTEPVASLSPEAEKATFDHLAGSVLEDGTTKKHPNLELNREIIQQQIAAPSNKALKEFYHRQPDLAVALIDAHVDKTRRLLADKAQALVNDQKNKQQEADSTINTGPSGGGVPTIAADGSNIEEAGRAWGKAFANAE